MSNPPRARRAAGNGSGKRRTELSLHPHELQTRAQLKRALAYEISQREIDLLSEIVDCTMAIRRRLH